MHSYVFSPAACCLEVAQQDCKDFLFVVVEGEEKTLNPQKS